MRRAEAEVEAQRVMRAIPGAVALPVRGLGGYWIAVGTPSGRDGALDSAASVDRFLDLEVGS